MKQIMLLKLMMIVAIGLPSWYYADMSSNSRIEAYVLPLLTFASILALCLWIIEVFQHFGENRQKRS